MLRVKTTIDIAAPANLIWRWITEPGKVLIWNTNYKEYKIIDEKKEKVGTTYYMIQEIRGVSRRYDFVVTEWIENKRFAFRITSKEVDIDAEHSYTIEPTEKGCRVTFEEDIELGGVAGKIVGPIFAKRAMKKHREEMLEILKDSVEAES
ncbi:MAG: SRPBCC family protein [Methanomicrobia archaeon]|nr:SRPBCC family protein [Methanomicrobia archaeon]